MRVEITFFENAIETKATDRIKIFPNIYPVQKLRQFVEKSDWEGLLAGYEKYINWFSWIVIIASVVFLTPVCINICIR